MTMVAPMMPVEAAISALTMMTDRASMALDPPIMVDRVINMRSARRERSSSTPISTNRGTAMRMVLFITPMTRWG